MSAGLPRGGRRRPGTGVALELPGAHAGAHGGVRLAGEAALPGAPNGVRDVHGIDEVALSAVTSGQFGSGRRNDSSAHHGRFRLQDTVRRTGKINRFNRLRQSID